MTRLAYSLLFYFIQPLIWLRLIWRSRKQPAYLRRAGERYGFYSDDVPSPAKLFWLHAVSVGETRAAEPLIRTLLDEFPEHSILMTHMTPTGREAGKDFTARFGKRLIQAYLPYDLPGAGRRFLSRFRPICGVVMETEIWPNLIAAARRRAIPMLLVNARLSERSHAGYKRFLPLIRPTVAALDAIAAQTDADARRFAELGARRIEICGNLKFDVAPSPEKQALGKKWRGDLGSRPVWLAASTREGEEILILDAFAQSGGNALLLLVPRHPQRFDEVAAQIRARGLPFLRRSADKIPGAETRVWLGDSMGEMPAYYTVADLALIGGTLLPFGGQNLIEAAVCRCPALAGPHTFNFARATEDSIASGAALRVVDAFDAIRQCERLLNDEKTLNTMRESALLFSRKYRGATEKTLGLIREITALRKAG
ncbi:MAG: lipid IV(A) 3-deoxy-D-manno-octulosonic acid transferase [Candidatus Accumulibacter sp.]|jgi:3-deoxy-D-manno-octulosonic-acid transferase|nr:lipid IV(A) 3-deoxy-D-manno-octulosonic acid transferase [Accumulibacter sp.]